MDDESGGKHSHQHGEAAARHAPRPHRYHSLVLEALRRQAEPVSATAVYAAMRRDGSRIGLSTIYRELQALAVEGRVQAVRIGIEAVYRVADGDLFICDDCGRTLHPKPISDADQAAAGFFDPDTPLTLHGRCRRCVAAAGEVPESHA